MAVAAVASKDQDLYFTVSQRFRLQVERSVKEVTSSAFARLDDDVGEALAAVPQVQVLDRARQ